MNPPPLLSHWHRSGRRFNARHGILLYEMMIVIGLISIAGTMFAHLFRSAFMVSANSQKAAMAIARLDAILDTLHRDTWGASAIVIASDQSLTLTKPDGSSVIWRSGAGETLSRTLVHEPAKIFTDVVAGIKWTRQGAGFTIIIPNNTNGPGETRTVVSQYLLAQGEQP